MASFRALLASFSIMCRAGALLVACSHVNMALHARIQCLSCFEANGWTRMALDRACKATIMYWLLLLERGWNCPVSSVNRRLMGSSWSSIAFAVGAVGVVVGVVVGISFVFVDLICCHGCAICPKWVSSVSGQ